MTATRTHFTDEQGEIEERKVALWERRNVEWLKEKYGRNVLKAVSHRDERTPHIAAYVLPEVNGRLNAKDFVGDRPALRKLQDEYGEAMKELKLERGERGSRATHQDIGRFYSTILTPVRLEIERERIRPPRALEMTTQKGRLTYCDEVIRSTLEQVEEQVETIRQQSLLTLEETRKREDAERRAAERVAEAERRAQLAEERLRAQVRVSSELGGRLERLEHSHATVRSELLKEREKTERFAMLAGRLKERLSDIPLPEVMGRLGYRGEPVGEAVVYRDAQRRVALCVRGGEASDSEGRIVCRNSIDLVCHVRNEHEREDGQEREFSQGEAVTWLARTFGAERAAAAYLVEREQAITAALGPGRLGREGTERSLEQGRADPAERERQSYGFDR